jgi:hypothetical protein
MDTKIKKLPELPKRKEIAQPLKLYNPDALDHTKDLRIKGIELTDAHTRIDFLYRSSSVYDNGGWVNIKSTGYIRPVGSDQKFGLIAAEGIPIAPQKHYFKAQGALYPYTLIFPALPKGTKRIDIIEDLSPGDHFNFFDVSYSRWMSVIHPLDIHRNNN